MKKNIVLVSAGAFAVSGIAFAGSVTQDLTGIHSYESLADALNHQLTFNIGAGSEVVGFSFVDVTGVGLEADGVTEGGPSWGNEMSMAIGSSAAPAVAISFFPGEGSATAGGPWGPESGAGDLIAAGLNFVVEADGILTMEFYEGYNDHVGSADAKYTGGSVTIEYNEIPAPGALALLGLAGIAGIRRRRNR